MEENPTSPPCEASAPPAAAAEKKEPPMFASTATSAPAAEAPGSPVAISFLSRVRPGFWDR